MISKFPEVKIHVATKIEQSVYDLIKAAVFHFFESFPDQPLDIREIALSTSTDFESVKKVCYFLLATRKIKASFFPVHIWCWNRLGDTGTVADIKQSIAAGIFDGKCEYCGSKIKGKASIEVGMAFWKLGSIIQ